MCATCAKRPIASERSRENAGPPTEQSPALMVMEETLRRLRVAELSLMELTRKAVKDMENLSAVRRHRVAGTGR